MRHGMGERLPAVELVGTAQRLADDVLFPAALRTDAADVVPGELLDALADAGLYGITGPASAGGLGADAPTVWAVAEALASGCLTTTFVWAQHNGVVRAVAASENAAMQDWIEPVSHLCGPYFSSWSRRRFTSSAASRRCGAIRMVFFNSLPASTKSPSFTGRRSIAFRRECSY